MRQFLVATCKAAGTDPDTTVLVAGRDPITEQKLDSKCEEILGLLPEPLTLTMIVSTQRYLHGIPQTPEAMQKFADAMRIL